MIIICTPLPIDSIITPPVEQKTQVIDVRYGYLEGVKREDGFEVSRLISTDPHDYLDKRYAPGSIYKAE